MHFQPQQKGKQGTKGAKQIAEENVATLKFYRNLAAGGTAVYLAVSILLFDLTWFSIVSDSSVSSEVCYDLERTLKISISNSIT